MPVIYEASFVNGVQGPFFQWNSSDDSEGLADYATDRGLTGTVAESGPTFEWEGPADSGSVDMSAGCIVVVTRIGIDAADNVRFSVEARTVTAGSWVADQYGRPFNLNDLTAE